MKTWIPPQRVLELFKEKDELNKVLRGKFFPYFKENYGQEPKGYRYYSGSFYLWFKEECKPVKGKYRLKCPKSDPHLQVIGSAASEVLAFFNGKCMRLITERDYDSTVITGMEKQQLWMGGYSYAFDLIKGEQRLIKYTGFDPKEAGYTLVEI